MKRLSFPCLLLPSLAALGAAQSQSVEIYREGQTVPNGDLAVGFDHLRVNEAGDWLSIVRTDNPSATEDAILVWNGIVLLEEGKFAPFGSGTLIDEIVDTDMGDDGERCTVVETSAGFLMYYDTRLVLQESDSASMAGFGPLASFVNVAKVNIVRDDVVLMRCGVNDPAISGTPFSCLIRLELDSFGGIVDMVLLTQAGDVLPGQTVPLSLLVLGDNALDVIDDNSGVWSGFLAPGAAPNRHVLYQNSGTLLAQGGVASGVVPGRSWASAPFEANSASTSGSIAYAAQLDGTDLSNDEVIVLDGALYRREGDSLPFLGGNPTIEMVGVKNLHVTDAGEPIYLVAAGPAGPMDRVILRDEEVVLREGWVLPSGATITGIFDVDGMFEASDSGRFLLTRVELDGGDEGLVLTQKTVGQAYCSAEPNSTGVPAVTSAVGVSVIGLDELSLLTTNAPAGQFAYYLASLTPDDVPFPGGSQGRLCLGGNIGRYTAQVGQISAAGTFGMELDLQSIPTTPVSTVMTGDVWHFQLWNRDANPMPTSNFSRPVRVLFY